MRMSLSIGGALLALAAFASTAEARMMGGGIGMSSSMSPGGGNATMSSSMGSPRGFSPDGRTFSASGRTFSPDGLQTRVKGSNWKRPIDSDGGMLGDPPVKPPKASTQPSRDGTSRDHAGYGGGYGHHGYIDQYGHFHPYFGGGSNASNGSPLACVGRIGGC
jgi:hypothetical protein